MAKKFAELRSKMSPESRARADEKAQVLLSEEPLYDFAFRQMSGYG